MKEIVTYDVKGRMKYHPEYHHNTNKHWTESDTEYACKFCEIDNLEVLAMALGRTADSVSVKINTLKRQGKYEHYKNLNKHW